MVDKTDRDIGLDFIKCIATICVVLLHAGNLGRMLNVFHYMAGCAIPLFFMISGRLMISNYEKHYSSQNMHKANLYVLRKVERIILLVLMWIIPYMLIEYLMFKKITNPIILLVQSILQKGAMNLFWYFWALIFLYLITPVVCRFKRNSTLLYHCILIFLICLCVIVACVDLVEGLRGVEIFEKRVPQTFRLYSHLMYYCIGDWLYNSKLTIEIKNRIKKLNKLILAGTTFLIGGILGMYQYVMTQIVMHVTSPEYCFCNPIILMWNITLFVILPCFMNKVTNKATQLLISKSLGIYVIHVFLIRLAGNMNIYNEANGVSNFIVLLTCSYAIASIFLHIPVIKRLIVL